MCPRINLQSFSRCELGTPLLKLLNCKCSVLRYLSVTIVTLYPVRHDRYMIVKVHSYVKVVLLIPSTVL